MILTVDILLLIVCYPIIYFKILQTVAKSAAQSRSTKDRHGKQKRKMSKKLLVIIMVVIISYTPYGIVTNIIENPPGLKMRSAYYIALTFATLHSLCNPMLFLWQGSLLRGATFAFLRMISAKMGCRKATKKPVPIGITLNVLHLRSIDLDQTSRKNKNKTSC